MPVATPPRAGRGPALLTEEGIARVQNALAELALDGWLLFEFRGQYTLIRRDVASELVAVPYHEAFATYVERAAAKLREAATLADDRGLRTYLELRAEAMLSDDYRASDLAWLDMNSNRIDLIIGPIEDYEDAVYGRKAAHEGVVVLKDLDWSARLRRLGNCVPPFAMPVTST